MHLVDDLQAFSFPRLAEVGSLTDLPPAFASLLVAVRRHLHSHPELGFEEVETSRLIREVLEEYGLTVQGPLAKTGLYVDIEGAHPGPHIGYRADIDALPIQDAKQVRYASRNVGVAHLCGHDAHTAVGIGVALLLHGLRSELSGTVRVFFQPNEEGSPSGAVAMIEGGVLEGLEAVYCVHVDPTLEAGRFGLITGAVTAAADRFRLWVRGETTGHSARPHQATDTIWIATQIITLLYQLVGRVSDARKTAVLTVCRFHGGEAYNVIPAEVEFGGTLRTTSRDERDHLKHYIGQAAKQIASLHDADVEVAFDEGAPAVINDGRLIDHVARTIEAFFDRSALYRIPAPSMGAEDFAHYLDHLPGALVRVGTCSGPGTAHPLHDAQFDLDEHALAPAARLMAAVLFNHTRGRILDEEVAD